jgi:hypothetical protein
MRRAFLGSPFGAVKASEFGRENAMETLHEFVRSKNILIPSGRGNIPACPPRGSAATIAPVAHSSNHGPTLQASSCSPTCATWPT